MNSVEVPLVAESRLGLLGMDSGAPVVGWRAGLRGLVAFLGRTALFCLGFHWVGRTGSQATKQQAPVLIVGPHSTFFDALGTLRQSANLDCKITASQSRHIRFRLSDGRSCLLHGVSFLHQQGGEPSHSFNWEMHPVQPGDLRGAGGPREPGGGGTGDGEAVPLQPALVSGNTHGVSLGWCKKEGKIMNFEFLLVESRY